MGKVFFLLFQIYISRNLRKGNFRHLNLTCILNIIYPYLKIRLGLIRIGKLETVFLVKLGQNIKRIRLSISIRSRLYPSKHLGVMICFPECQGPKDKGQISLFDHYINKLSRLACLQLILTSHLIQISIKIALPVHILPILSLHG